MLRNVAVPITPALPPSPKRNLPAVFDGLRKAGLPEE
jgi:hypothetical protein